VGGALGRLQEFELARALSGFAGFSRRNLLDFHLNFADGVVNSLDMLLSLLPHKYLFHHASILRDHSLFGSSCQLDGAVTESNICVRRGTIDRPAFHRDMLFAQVDRLFHRDFNDAPENPHAALIYHALTDNQFFLNDGYRRFPPGESQQLMVPPRAELPQHT